MVIRGDGSVRGDEAVAGSREGVAGFAVAGRLAGGKVGVRAVQVNGLR